MTPQKIMDGLADKNRLLSVKNDEYKTFVERYAAAKADYNTALAQTMLRLKTDGMQISIITKVAQGDHAVSKLGYQMDIAEGMMNACRESIKDIRESIGSYRSILTWLRMEANVGEG